MIRNYLKGVVLIIITFLAIRVIKKHKPYIIAVTGNIGKTSTKDNIVSALGTYKIVYSQKSFNSDFGIPLTILKCSTGWSSSIKWIKIILKGISVYFGKEYADYLILEVGADKKGDIASITKWLKPDIAVMTQFAAVPVHIENYKNREELIREKRYLMEALVPGGLFIYNADCKDSSEMAASCMSDTISFGLKYGDYRAGTINNNIYEGKVEANVVTRENANIKLELYDVLGEAAILCALPAIIIADAFGENREETCMSLSRQRREPGRMRLLAGISNSYIIDDTYNSSPLAVESGLKTLRSLSNRHRKIMILGDMLELGEYTSAEHKRIGMIAAESGNILVTVGSRSRLTALAAREAGMREGYVLECKGSKEAGEAVREIINEDDVVYIKGSQSMRMEKATALIVSSHIEAKHNLPRQEIEWLLK